MDPWAVIHAHPFVTLTVMGLVAMAGLWAGLVLDHRSAARHLAELERLKRDTAELLKDVRR